MLTAVAIPYLLGLFSIGTSWWHYVNAATPNVPHNNPHISSVANNNIRYNHQQDGSGIKIAIVDSGVDYAHPAIGQCPGPTCKIITGYDFVGDEYNGFNKPIEDHNPHDVCNGHGTTMAGIISGESAGLNGIAHKARLGIYRVLGCNGMTQPDIVVAALNMAYQQHMDIITLSFIAKTDIFNRALINTVDTIANKGIIIVSAFNYNLDTSQWQTLLSPPPVFSVATSKEQHVDQHFLLVNGVSTVRLAYFTNARNHFTINKSQVVLPEIIVSHGLCMISNDVQNKLLVVTFNPCDPFILAKRAASMGAIGIITEIGSFVVSHDQLYALPVFFVEQSDIQIIAMLRARSEITIAFPRNENMSNQFTVRRAGSSTKPVYTINDLTIPDIIAPGVNLRLISSTTADLTYPVSGNDVASAHFAGNAALYLQAKLKKNPTRATSIKTIFQNSAMLLMLSREHTSLSVDRQGAGEVAIQQAIQSLSRIIIMRRRRSPSTK